jgi:DNA-binding FrmR family transcriptional regulator
LGNITVAGEPTNGDIMNAIATLQGQFTGVIRELDAAKESRQIMHSKLEAQSQRLQNAEFGIEQQVQISAQIREETKALATEQRTIKNDIQPLLDLREHLPPVVETWKDLNKWSKRLVYLLTVGGVSVITAVVWFGDMLTKAVKSWLGIT